MAQKIIPKNCTSCGKELDRAGKFCKECGTSIESMMVEIPIELFCPNCGQKHGANDKFCRFCALDFTKASEEIQTPSTAQIPPTPVSSMPNIPQQVQPIQSDSQLAEQTAPANPASFISPAGAAFVVICFFMPWLEWSACGVRKTVTGAELSQFDGSFLLYPLAGIVSIAAYFICKSQKKIWKARPFILVSSALGLLLLFYKVNSIPSSPEFMGQRITAADLGFKPQIGGFGTVIGFILAMIGCAFMSRRATAVPTDFSPVATSLSNNFQSTINSLAPNKAAMWTYVAPLILPIALFFVLGVISDLVRFSGLIILAIPSPIIAQIVFLNKEPHKRNTFVRFHAFQSLLIIGAAILLSILLQLLLRNILSDMEPVTYRPWIAILVWGLPLSYYGLMIFCAVKANKGEIFKASILGDWAMQRANKVEGAAIPSYSPHSAAETPQFVNITEPKTSPDSLENIKESEISFDLPRQSEKVEKKDETTDFSFEYPESQLSKIDKNIIGAVVGVAVVILAVIVFAVFNQSGGQAPKTNTAANTAKNSYTSSYTSSSSSNMGGANSYSSSNSNSSTIGSYGRLSTNLNLRTAPNKTALSVGIHFQNARFKIIAEESYDTEEGYSTWYKVQIIEYGCDAQGNLGCGKNNPNDADEGWLNAKYISLE